MSRQLRLNSNQFIINIYLINVRLLLDSYIIILLSLLSAVNYNLVDSIVHIELII